MVPGSAAGDGAAATAPRPSPLLALPGAVRASGPDQGIAWHYGDPIAEQRAAIRAAALLDRSHRDVLTVTGPDRLTWLHTVTSQHLTDLTDGASTEALVLSPQGHVEHHMVITELGGVTYLDTEPGRGPALRAYLESMRFWSKVEIADAASDPGADLGLLAVAGPGAGEIIAGAIDVDPDASAIGLDGGGFARRIAGGVELVVPRERLAADAGRLVAAGAAPAGSWAADALRVPTRRPRWGVDTDERTIPNETSWMDSAVHLDKGCYRGQETVARVHNLGRPPRRLVLLALDGSVDRLPATGDPVLTAAGRTVGRLGTVAYHHEDGPIALALLKRALGQDVSLVAGGVDAVVDPDDADSSGGRAGPMSATERPTLLDLRRR